MQLILDSADVWSDLEDCKVGDEKVVTFTVIKKGPETIEGKATHAEYAEGYGEEESVNEESVNEETPRKKGMPKAIVMISK